jgi:protease-4
MTNETNQTPADALTRIAEALQSMSDVATDVLEQQEQRIRNANTWSTIKRTAILTGLIGGAASYATLYAAMAGLSAGPSELSVAVLGIEGAIGGMNPSNADVLAPAIRRTCEDGKLSGLVLRINSSGGSPSDAERIAAAIG